MSDGVVTPSTFEAALWSDPHKGAAEARLTEIDVVLAEFNHTLRHPRRRARPRRGPVPAALKPTDGKNPAPSP
ncbi:hypothetical protein [Streptomyces sp. Qhu_M48]|uniref:hypothetical protein n=1 Tax=Streptomyces sp. Qhu_M48 TaxID=3435889 RepID=UPI003F4FD103